MAMSLEERFWSRVLKTGVCWWWTGACLKAGYGSLRPPYPSAVPVLAHRVSWELNVGPIPDGMVVCHRCDNPPCVRPDHLFVDTQRGNLADMVRKDRHSRGERHYKARLTPGQVEAIRARRALGEPLKDLAREFDVAFQTISKVARNAAWKSIGSEDRRLTQ
jgi:hypothetical protein